MPSGVKATSGRTRECSCSSLICFRALKLLNTDQHCFLHEVLSACSHSAILQFTGLVCFVDVFSICLCVALMIITNVIQLMSCRVWCSEKNRIQIWGEKKNERCLFGKNTTQYVRHHFLNKK